jgi:hypothetical protein
MNSPLNNISVSGRSHYREEIYISLSDKQTEYANLTEDVLISQASNMVKYAVRAINLSRVKQSNEQFSKNNH